MDTKDLPPRMSLTRRAFLARAAAASAVGPMVLAASGPSAFFAAAHASSDDDSKRQSKLRLSPGFARNKIETEHTLVARIRPAVPNVLVQFEVVLGPNAGTSGTGITDAAGIAEFSYIGGAEPGTDVIIAWTADESGDPETFAFAIKHWQLTEPPRKLLVAPRSATNLIDTEHTVVATVVPAVPGVPVVFQIITGPNAGLGATVETDENGTGEFVYTGSAEGTDVILAFIDADLSGEHDLGEKVVTVTKRWVLTLDTLESETESDESEESDESGESDESDEN